ncbi:MAG: DUF3276 family protein [Spirochaetales bacterium]|nr:DUF3276 family protein [Spirochaetales bacterium]
MGIRGEVFSTKTSTGKRTYFFNIKENRHGDLFLNMVESKKQVDSSFERHSMVVFEEDLETFLDGLNQAVAFLKAEKKVAKPASDRPVRYRAVVRDRDRDREDVQDRNHE